MTWIDEIVELHDFFEAWFRGTTADLGRVELVLAPDFTIVGPDGVEKDRAGIVEDLAGVGGLDDSLEITTSEHQLVHDAGDSVLVRYVERHDRIDRPTRRVSTALLTRAPNTPNGWAWVAVHETWAEPG